MPFGLTNEHVAASVPPSGHLRSRLIDEQEAAWKALPYDHQKHSRNDANTAAHLLSAISFSDFSQPIPCTPPSRRDKPSSSRSSRESRTSRSAASCPPFSSSGSIASSGSDSDIKPSAHPSSITPPVPTVRDPLQDVWFGDSPELLVRRETIRPRIILPSPLPGNQVAFWHASTNRRWCLGTLLRIDRGIHVVRDDFNEEGEDHDIYRVPASSVRLVGPRNTLLLPGDRVAALYPATSTFYPAKLVKKKGPHSWNVKFDAEEEGNDTNKVVNTSFILG